MTTLPLDRIIRVTSTITATQPLRADFGRTLLVTSDDTLRPPHRTRVYADIAAVGRDFETTSQPYLAAQKYFGVTPYPKNLVIGSWFSAAGNARIFGGRSPSELAGLQAVTAGTLGCWRHYHRCYGLLRATIAECGCQRGGKHRASGVYGYCGVGGSYRIRSPGDG